MRNLLTLGSLVAAPFLVATEVAPASIIYKDVAIIGGGSSGAYSAVRLREDEGLSTIIIEKQDHLGGHVDSYDDPATGRSYEYGVQNFIDLGNAKAFFHRMNISTIASSRVALTSRFVDFTNGQELRNYTPPPAADVTAGLQRYRAIAEQWDDIMQPGFWTFPAPHDIPEDLLLPFSDFIVKYNLTVSLPRIFSTTGFGIHNLMESLTMWVMRSFGSDLVKALLGLNASFVPESRRNQDLYDKILAFLGTDVLLSSTVVSSSRSASGVVLQVKGPGNKMTKIHAKRLLVAIEPTRENMAPLDLDHAELRVFNAFEYSKTFVGVVSHPSLPVNVSIFNTPLAAQPANWTASIPAPPFNARIEYFGEPSNLFRVIMVGDETLDQVTAKGLVDQSFANMVSAGTLSAAGPKGLQWHAFEAHGLVSAHASKAQVQSGFIQRLNALQGGRSTWFTGAAWSIHLTTNLWISTDTVLSKLVASL